MKVTTIHVHVRQRVNGLSVIEMGAEAEIDTNEDWHLAQNTLYTQLTEQVEEIREKFIKDVEETEWDDLPF